MRSKAQVTTLEAIKAIPVPADAKHNPISHGDLVNLVLQTAERNGLTLQTSGATVLKNGSEVFAELVFSPDPGSKINLLIGVRNALGKSKNPGILLGFSGENLGYGFYASDVRIPGGYLGANRGDLPKFLEEVVNDFIRKISDAKACLRSWETITLSPNGSAGYMFELEANKCIRANRVVPNYWNYAGRLSHTVLGFFLSNIQNPTIEPNPWKRAKSNIAQVQFFTNTWCNEGPSLTISKTSKKRKVKTPEPVKTGL